MGEVEGVGGGRGAGGYSKCHSVWPTCSAASHGTEASAAKVRLRVTKESVPTAAGRKRNNARKRR